MNPRHIWILAMAWIGVCAFSSPATATDRHFTEPHTGAVFPKQLHARDHTLQITGADRRQELGKNAYAVAHYIGYTLNSGRDKNALLLEFAATDKPKAILLKGVYPKVPARGIRWAWKRGLKRAGYSNAKKRKNFVGRFTRAFVEGDELLFDATDPNHLIVLLNGQPFGEWNDPQLTRAIWEICVGKKADIVERSNFVNTQLIKP